MNKLIATLFLLWISYGFSQAKPDSFVYLSTIDSSIKVDLRYLGKNNFIGKPIDGYLSACLMLTKPTAKALQKVQQKLKAQGLGLKIFDAYRPQQAVDHFVRWAKVLNDTLMKQKFYPKVPKNKLFKLGYIASKSGHSRGSTVDLTLVDLNTNQELDMGSPFDFFGIESHPFYEDISHEQKKNRMLLRKVMLKHGFKPYDQEWWHFTLKNEPYPNTYFNFPVH